MNNTSFNRFYLFDLITNCNDSIFANVPDAYPIIKAYKGSAEIIKDIENLLKSNERT